MIAHLSGTIIARRGNTVIVDVAGVGYAVTVSDYTLGKTAAAAQQALHIHTHVWDQGIDLYGFLTIDECGLFEMLITVSGVGPKAAMKILSMASPSGIVAAIAAQDIVMLTRASGVGKKMAERIIVDLQTKVTRLGIALDDMTAPSGRDVDVMDALVGLGYTASEARAALEALPRNLTEADVSTRIKTALKMMGAARR